jgi:hypothetical protein
MMINKDSDMMINQDSDLTIDKDSNMMINQDYDMMIDKGPNMLSKDPNMPYNTKHNKLHTRGLIVFPQPTSEVLNFSSLKPLDFFFSVHSRNIKTWPIQNITNTEV